MNDIFRGDVRLCDFGKPKDLTIAKNRPVIVIQNNVANRLSGMTIVAIVTSNPKVGDLPVGVEIEPGLSGLSHRSYANLGHIYTVDKRDVGTKIGKIADEKMQEIDKAIEISLGLKTVR